MGLYITLRGSDDKQVGALPDPLGGVFDASGDFDDLLGRGRSPILDAVDPYGSTRMASDQMPALLVEVESLMESVSDSAREAGRAGQAWRGLVRFRTMIDHCRQDSSAALVFEGD